MSVRRPCVSSMARPETVDAGVRWVGGGRRTGRRFHELDEGEDRRHWVGVLLSAFVEVIAVREEVCVVAVAKLGTVAKQ